MHFCEAKAGNTQLFWCEMYSALLLTCFHQSIQRCRGIDVKLPFYDIASFKTILSKMYRLLILQITSTKNCLIDIW